MFILSSDVLSLFLDGNHAGVPLLAIEGCRHAGVAVASPRGSDWHEDGQ